ncbi:hypothetical protein D9M69_579990 [compost metagenome]
MDFVGDDALQQYMLFMQGLSTEALKDRALPFRCDGSQYFGVDARLGAAAVMRLAIDRDLQALRWNCGVADLLLKPDCMFEVQFDFPRDGLK